MSGDARVASRAAVGPAPVDPRPPVATLRAATVCLGGRTIWRDVDLTVAPGEFVVVLGPNGAGKSTLLRALLGIVVPVAGAARTLDAAPGSRGLAVDHLPQRRPEGVAAQIRGDDLVALGLDGHRWGVRLPFGRRRRELRTRVAATLAAVGATGFAHRPVGELSGGELQRVLIAQALVRGPRLLLLDEPLAGLDLATQASIAALLRRLCRDRGMAVVVVTHDVNPFDDVDQLVYVAGGGVAAGTPAEVLNSARLSALYGAPVAVLTAPDGRLVVAGAGV